MTRKISYYSCGDGYCNSTKINTIDIPINRSVKMNIQLLLELIRIRNIILSYLVE
jgi:hypothetical protein